MCVLCNTLRLHSANLCSLWSANLNLFWLSLHFNGSSTIITNNSFNFLCSLSNILIHLLLILVLLLDHSICEWERRRLGLLRWWLMTNNLGILVHLRIRSELRSSLWCGNWEAWSGRVMLEWCKLLWMLWLHLLLWIWIRLIVEVSFQTIKLIKNLCLRRLWLLLHHLLVHIQLYTKVIGPCWILHGRFGWLEYLCLWRFFTTLLFGSTKEKVIVIWK